MPPHFSVSTPLPSIQLSVPQGFSNLHGLWIRVWEGMGKDTYFVTLHLKPIPIRQVPAGIVGEHVVTPLRQSPFWWPGTTQVVQIIDYHVSFQKCCQWTFKAKKKETTPQSQGIYMMDFSALTDHNASQSHCFYRSSPTIHCTKACCLIQVMWWEQLHWWGCNPHMEHCCPYTEHESFCGRCGRWRSTMHLFSHNSG